MAQPREAPGPAQPPAATGSEADRERPGAQHEPDTQHPNDEGPADDVYVPL
jgi:hypothetical protein